MKSIAVAAFLALGVHPCLGAYNATTSEDRFAVVPAEFRAQLREQLSAMVAAETARRWDEVYDLLAPTLRGQMSKTAYVRAREEAIDKTRPLVTSFTVDTTTVTYSESGTTYGVGGCATILWRGREMVAFAYVVAQLHDGQWYLTEVNVQFVGPETPAAPCELYSVASVPPAPN